MKHIVLFVLMLIPPLVSAVTTTVYDFSNRTAGLNIFAFEGVSGTQIPLSNSLPSSQYSASSYSDITSNNNVYHDYINYAKNEYPAIRYVIEIDENISNINQLDVFWNGFGVNSKNNQIDGVLIYIWNNSNNSYELVTQNTNDWVVELSQSVTSNITDYIDNDNKITVYVVSQGKTFNGETNWIGTDYFSLSITSESSVVPIANFKFDETQYDDVAGEIKDSIGTFHSRAKSAQPVDGKVCRALDLSATGTADYAIIDNKVLDGKNEFSISLWEKTAKTGNQSFLSGATPGSNNELIMWFTRDTSFSPHLQNSANGSLPISSIAGDQWRHLVWTHGDNKSCLFIDKVAQGCITQATNTLDIESLILGQEQDSVGGRFSSSQAFDGLLDELVIFDQVIGQGQIDEIYDFQNNGLDLDGEPIVCPDIPPVEFASPIANFKFDETEYADVAEEVKDSVGNFHSQAKLAQPVDGKVCRAVDLSTTGTGDYVVLDKDVLHDKDEFSISLWAKTAKETNQSLLSGASSGSNNELIMWFNSDTRFIPYLQNGQNGTLSISSIAGNTWHHLVWTHGRNRSCLFIDKEAQGCVTQTTSTLNIESLILGQEQDSVGGGFSSSQAFNGLIDELIIFEDAIGQEQIDQIYDYQNNGLGLDGEVISCSNEIIAQYSMEETSWNDVANEVIDETGNFDAQGVDGASTNNATPALTGNPGTCGYGTFDGVDDYIELPSTFENLQDSFTITAWVNPSNLNSGSRIFIDDQNNQQGFGFSLGDPGNGRLRFFSRGVSPISVDTNSSIAANTWSFVTAVHNSVTKTRQIYINGVAQAVNGTSTSSTYTGTWGVDTGPASIGGETSASGENGSNFHFTGAIDEVHVFKGALSAAEINEVYAKRHACAEPVIHHYEIVHDGNGLTCAVEPITIKACTNSDCSASSDLSTESVSLDFTITSPTDGTSIKFSPTFTGSTSFDFNHTKAETITLSIDGATIAASNPIECSGFGSSCEMIFESAGFRFLYGTSESLIIPTQTSAVNFDSLKLQAIKDISGVCEGIFTGDVAVNLSQQNIQPNDNSGLSFQINNNNIAKHPTFSSNVLLNFSNNSKAELPLAKYLDAGKIQLHASYSDGDISLDGNSNQFWVKPARFEIAAVNSNGNLDADSVDNTTTHTAGDNFTFTVSAVNNDGALTQNYLQSDGRLQLSVERILPMQSTSVEGGFLYASGQSRTTGTLEDFQDATLANFSSDTRGVSSFTAAQYNEVGIFSIDISDVDYGEDGGNGLTRELIDAEKVTVGRFTPSYFVQTIYENTETGESDHGAITGKLHDSQCETETWVYSGQTTNSKGSIRYVMPPVLTISAFNSLGQPTKNYHSDFAKIKGLEAGVAENIISFNSASSTHTNGLPLSSNLSAIGSFTDVLEMGSSTGVVKYTLSDEHHFTYIRNADSEVGPFYAAFETPIDQIRDSDGITIGSSTSYQNPNFVSEEGIGVQVRFGRWFLENSFGPETSVQVVPSYSQFLNNGTFVTNTDDTCSVIVSTKEEGRIVGLLLSDGTLSSNYTELNESVNGFLENGLSRDFILTEPGQGNVGDLNLEYTPPSWLLYDWNSDGTYDNNPTSTATFGLYRGNDRIISWREVTN